MEKIEQVRKRRWNRFDLTLEDETVIALQKALHFVHPLAHHAGKGTLLTDDLWRAANELIRAACLGVLNHHCSHSYDGDDEQPDPELKRKWGSTLLKGFWPLAFELRKESPDEAFARMVLAAA